VNNRCRFAVLKVLALDGDMVGHVLGVMPHPPDKRRAPARLPWQTEEVDARLAGHAALVLRLGAAGFEHSPIVWLVAFPLVALVVSGGHTFLVEMRDHLTYRLLGQTLDDAAGEAFDKGARLLGLGYPGGPEVDRLAKQGDPKAFDFPRSAPGELDFSFSGLKTSLLYTLRDRPDADRADLAASYQRAIVDALVARTGKALHQTGLERLAIGGGVAANSELRDAVAELGVPVWVPPMELCTDNAAMIASTSARPSVSSECPTLRQTSSKGGSVAVAKTRQSIIPAMLAPKYPPGPLIASPRAQ
jgi:hypothetical protein